MKRFIFLLIAGLVLSVSSMVASDVCFDPDVGYEQCITLPCASIEVLPDAVLTADAINLYPDPGKVTLMTQYRQSVFNVVVLIAYRNPDYGLNLNRQIEATNIITLYEQNCNSPDACARHV